MRSALIGITMLLSTFPALADERPRWCAEGAGDHALLFGEGFLFQLAAPKGWHVNGDPRVPGRQLLATVERDRRPETGCFLHFSQEPRATGQTAQRIIARDMARFRARGERGDVSQTAVKIECGKRAAPQVEASEPRPPLYERIAFIEEEKVFVIAELQCRSKEALKQVAPVFEYVLASYRLVSSNVEMVADKRARRRRSR